MNVLFKQATLLDASSPYHQQQFDVAVRNGKITEIAPVIEGDFDQVIASEQLHLSAGWVDMCCVSSDPGHEQTDDLTSITAAAVRGGFAEVALLPNTTPVVQTKASIAYIQQYSGTNGVRLHALAAVTKNCEGKDFTEMLDLHAAGAVAFTDGLKTLWNADLLLKTLQYLAPINGLLINRPQDTDLAQFGQMHEGITSTQLGMKGIPSAAEEIMILRDLQLLTYAAIQSNNSVLHFSQISTAAAVELIKKAKKQGLPVSCDVAAHQLAFTDEDLFSFDTNLKVSPPFRSLADKKALQKGLADGTIDAIVSAHHPLEEEVKKVEFDLADAGILGLQTAFSVALQNSGLPLPQLIEKLTSQPRNLLRLPARTIEVGAKMPLTAFDPTVSWTFTSAENASKSVNSPFFGKTLQGKVLYCG